jgi:hypothetical protein
MKTMQVDHGIPLVLQDSIVLLGAAAQLPSLELNDDWNLFPACRECNNWKGGMTIKQFRQELGKQIERCHRYSRNFRIAFRFAMIDVISHSANFILDSKAPMGVTEFDKHEAVIRHSLTDVGADQL